MYFYEKIFLTCQGKEFAFFALLLFWYKNLRSELIITQAQTYRQGRTEAIV